MIKIEITFDLQNGSVTLCQIWAPGSPVSDGQRRLSPGRGRDFVTGSCSDSSGSCFHKSVSDGLEMCWDTAFILIHLLWTKLLAFSLHASRMEKLLGVFFSVCNSVWRKRCLRSRDLIAELAWVCGWAWYDLIFIDKCWGFVLSLSPQTRWW